MGCCSSAQALNINENALGKKAIRISVSNVDDKNE